MTYVNLHHHDQYSKLDGYGSPERNARQAAALGMPALAQTNHGNLFGAFKHYRACLEAEIKPIIGCEFYVSPAALEHRGIIRWGTPEQRDEDVSRGAYTHLTVLAQNSEGVRNLYRLQDIGFTRGYYYEPRIDFTTLAEHSDGLIVLSGCAGSAISTRLRLDQVDEAEETAAFLASVFPGRFFIEYMEHGIYFEEKLNQGLLQLAKRLDLPLVVTQDSHYGLESDAKVHDALLCLQFGNDLDDPKRFKFDGSGYYLKSPAEMTIEFAHVPDGIKNTLLVTEMIGDYSEVFSKQDLMPRDEEQQFWPMATEGMHSRLPDSCSGEEYDRAYSRLSREAKVIIDMGYPGYFVVLAQIIAEAKSRGILFAPCRGSGGGSYVAYAMGITDVNPLDHGLIFERFLNPSRKSPPDIDSDVQSSRRDEVYDIALELFGEAFIAKTITFGTIKARYALKDAARILKRTQAQANKLANQVPPDVRGRGSELKDLKSIRKTDPEVYDLALDIEGALRQFGTHAGGLVISPEPLRSIIPMKRDTKEKLPVTGFEQSDIEALGLIKHDMLALNTLDIIQKTLEML